MDRSLEVKSNRLSKTLEGDDYLRERLYPRASSYLYLHLVDLREALDFYRTSEKISILDYGCGGSPYRDLFPNSEYIRADFTPCEGLDLLLPADSSIPVSDNTFDMVLSTQVLEHVPESVNYVAECFRVLKAGFRIRGAKKLTCGPRALCFIINQWMWRLRAPKSSLFGFAVWGIRGLWRFDRTWLNRCADKYFKKYGIVDAEAPDSNAYIALLMHAERPALE